MQRNKKLSHISTTPAAMREHEIVPARLPLGMQVPSSSSMGGGGPAGGTVNLIIDRDKVNHFKQHKLQQLIDVIRAEG